MLSLQTGASRDNSFSTKPQTPLVPKTKIGMGSMAERNQEELESMEQSAVDRQSEIKPSDNSAFSFVPQFFKVVPKS